MKNGRKRTNKKFIPLAVSIACVLSAAVIIGYSNYVYSIPSVDEQEVNIYMYEPFHNRRALAKPDEEAAYKIMDKLPVLDGATAL